MIITAPCSTSAPEAWITSCIGLLRSSAHFSLVTTFLIRGDSVDESAPSWAGRSWSSLFLPSTSGHTFTRSKSPSTSYSLWVSQFCRNYTRASEPTDAVKMDINNSQYPSRVWLMIFYGLLDSMWQTTAYWLMGAMSNDPAKLAVFTGFCKISLR